MKYLTSNYTKHLSLLYAENLYNEISFNTNMDLFFLLKKTVYNYLYNEGTGVLKKYKLSENAKYIFAIFMDKISKPYSCVYDYNRYVLTNLNNFEIGMLCENLQISSLDFKNALDELIKINIIELRERDFFEDITYYIKLPRNTI